MSNIKHGDAHVWFTTSMCYMVECQQQLSVREMSRYMPTHETGLTVKVNGLFETFESDS